MWSTVLTLLLVILWLAVSAATMLGVFSGTLLELQNGWRGQYFEHNAETEKRVEEEEQEERNGADVNDANGRPKPRHQD